MRGTPPLSSAVGVPRRPAHVCRYRHTGEGPSCRIVGPRQHGHRRSLWRRLGPRAGTRERSFQSRRIARISIFNFERVTMHNRISFTMQSRMIYSVVSILLLGVGTASAQTSAPINFATIYQTIRGYGTSTAWQPVLNSTQANNLFGTGPGQVGLTILRSRIDPSSTTGGSNWATERANAQQAQTINSQVIVFATPWTPPAVWKTNGSVDDGSLITSDYDNFANYLNAFIAYEKAGGVNLYAISVQNEPDFLPSYESCGYSGAQLDAFVAREGGRINTRLMMPESDTFNTAESDPTLNDPDAVGYVSIVAGHTYGTRPFYYTNAKNHGKDVWMTEVTYTPAAGSNAQPTISDAISAAELYHQSMAVECR